MQSIQQLLRDFPILEMPIALGIALGINFVTSRFFGPWRQLASSYGDRSTFIGQKWHFQAVSTSWANYRSCVTVGINSVGLYVAPPSLFRGGHPPIVIPWAELQIEQKRRLLDTVYNLRTNACPKIRIHITSELFKKLNDNSSHVRDRRNFPT
jgi:hypothetical protein